MLHLLSQRPSLTGSGITLDALVREAASEWEQEVAIGLPREHPAPAVGGLEESRVHPLRFGAGELDFPLPGMSDVMPYPSSRFSELSEDELARYRGAWSRHVAAVASRFRPDVVHSHHVWLMSAAARTVLPGVPLVIHCHATGLRQLDLCPGLAREVLAGCSSADRFVVLHAGQRRQLVEKLGVAEHRVRVVGAGYREELFHDRGVSRGPAPRLLFVGKYSAAKGLPWLLDAYERLAPSRPGLELHLAGGGAGEEAEALRRRLEAMGSKVVQHGLVSQSVLADLMRRCDVFVLPSLYEGLPLVLVEAYACGCRLVATALPGVERELAPWLGEELRLVRPPRSRGVDQPVVADLGGFVDRLATALAESLGRGGGGAASAAEGRARRRAALESFAWRAVYARVDSVWRELVRDRAQA